MRFRTSAIVVLTLAFADVGCITSTTTLQSARTLEPGKAQIGAGASIPVSTRFVDELGDLVDTAADRLSDAEDAGRPVTEEEQRDAIESAMALLLLTPAPVYELTARIGLVPNVDAGLRLSGPAIRAEGKWNFLTVPKKLDMAVTAAYAYHTGVGASVASSVYDLFESLKLVEYSRHDIDLALLASGNPDAIVSAYGALRYIVAFTAFETKLDDLEAESGVEVADHSPIAHHFGGTIGIRVGPEWIHLMGELTVLRMWFAPTLLGGEVDLDGWIIAPAVGVEVRL